MSRSGFHRLLPSSARKTEPLLLLRMVGELVTSAHHRPVLADSLPSEPECRKE